MTGILIIAFGGLAGWDAGQLPSAILLSAEGNGDDHQDPLGDSSESSLLPTETSEETDPSSASGGSAGFLHAAKRSAGEEMGTSEPESPNPTMETQGQPDAPDISPSVPPSPSTPPSPPAPPAQTPVPTTTPMPAPLIPLPSEKDENEIRGSELVKRIAQQRDAIIILLRDFGRLDRQLRGGEMPERISLHYEEYRSLLRELAVLRRQSLDSAITSVRVDGLLADQTATLDVTFGIRVDSEMGGRVDLGFAEAFCESARFADGGMPALWKSSPDKPYWLFVDRPGNFELHCRMILEIDRTGTERRLQFQFPPSAARDVVFRSEEAISIARDDRTGKPFELSEDQKRITLSRAGSTIELAYRTLGDEKDTASTSFPAQGTLHVRLYESGIETTAEFLLDMRTATNEWTFRLLPNEQVRTVQVRQQGRALPIETRESGQQEDFQRFTVRSLQSVQGPVEVILVLDRPRPASPELVVAGFLQIENAEPQTGVLLISSEANTSIDPVGRRGLRVPTGEMPPTNPGEDPPRFLFVYQNQPAWVELRVERTQPSVSATSETTVEFTVEGVRLESTFQLLVRRAPLDRLLLTVPSGMTQISVRGSVPLEEQVRSVPGSPTQEVEIRLAEPVLNRLSVTLVGRLPMLLDNPFTLRLPFPTNQPDSPGILRVIKADNLVLRVDSLGSFLSVQAAPSVGDNGVRVWRSFRFEGGPAELLLTPSKLERQVTAQAEYVLIDRGERIRVSGQFDFRVEHGLLDAIMLELPEGVTNPQVHGKDLASALPPSVGRVSFPLATPSESTRVQVEYEVVTGPRGDPLTIPLVRPCETKAVSVAAEIRAPAGWTIRVAPPWTSVDAGPERLLPDESSILVHATDWVDQIAVNWSPVSSTLTHLMVPRLLVEETMLTDGRRRGRMRLVVDRLRTGLLEWSVPDSVAIVQLLVDGEPRLPQTSSEGKWSIPLPRADRPVAVEIGYESRGRPQRVLDRIDLARPRLSDRTIVGDIRWIVQTPNHRVLILASADGHAEAVWRWWGPILTSADSFDGERWLRGAFPDLNWSPEPALPAGGHFWIFSLGSEPSALSLITADRLSWMLLCSLMIFSAVLFAERVLRASLVSATIFMALLVLFLAMAYPQTMLWFWYGGQWAAYVLALRWILLTAGPKVLRSSSRSGVGAANRRTLIVSGPATRYSGETGRLAPTLDGTP